MYEDFVFRPSRPQRPNANRRKRKIVLALVLVAVSLLLLRNNNTSDETISPLAEEQPSFLSRISDALGIGSEPPESEPKEEELIAQIKQLVEQNTGIYSVYLYDLNESRGYGFNETMIFTAASVIKIPILAALYHEAESGAVNLDDRITLQARDIVDFGTGILQYEGLGRTYSLRTLANLLIKKSDNTAGYVLINSILSSNTIQERINGWGLTQTDIAQNKTTNADMALLFAKIYRGEIANDARTREMLGFLKDTDFENRLPRNLPDSVAVHHKIGNEAGIIHDVGIVGLAHKPYYIGVLTSDITDTTAAEDSIATISERVYEFYTTQPEN